jgi:uncharacterized membrane protein
MNALQHPMLVHLPLSAVILLPLLLLFAFYREKKGKQVPQIWYIASGLMILAAGSATLAVITGNMGEEIVEKTISESIIEKHEKWGELFVLLIYVTTLLSVVHLFMKDSVRKIARTGLLVLSLLLPVVGAQTGRYGGELVYKHNAAAALMMHYGNSEGVLVSKDSKEKTGKYDHDGKDDDHYEKKRHDDSDNDERRDHDRHKDDD